MVLRTIDHLAQVGGKFGDGCYGGLGSPEQLHRPSQTAGKRISATFGGGAGNKSQVSNDPFHGSHGRQGLQPQVVALHSGKGVGKRLGSLRSQFFGNLRVEREPPARRLEGEERRSLMPNSSLRSAATRATGLSDCVTASRHKHNRLNWWISLSTAPPVTCDGIPSSERRWAYRDRFFFNAAMIMKSPGFAGGFVPDFGATALWITCGDDLGFVGKNLRILAIFLGNPQDFHADFFLVFRRPDRESSSSGRGNTCRQRPAGSARMSR